VLCFSHLKVASSLAGSAILPIILPIADIIGVFVQLSLKMGENRTDSVKDGLTK
jgi:hypothetical protein